MAKGYLLLGHEVSKEIYEKYNNEKFPFMGRPVSLDGIHLWATNKEIEEQFPQYAAEAKQIIADIEKEIIAMEKPQTKKTFHSFLEDLQTIYREELANYNAVQNAFATAETDYNATMADRTAPEHIKLIARGDYERAKLTWEQGRLKAQDNYNTRVKELRQQMADFTADVYRATPDRIDQSAMQLLEIGIMSADEMDHLANKYLDNPPMMRVIGEYAMRKAKSFNGNEKHRAWEYEKLGRHLCNITDNGNALVGFDQMADYGRQGLGKDSTIARIHEKHWDRLYGKACEAYDNFIVQPGGTEE